MRRILPFKCLLRMQLTLRGAFYTFLLVLALRLPWGVGLVRGNAVFEAGLLGVAAYSGIPLLRLWATACICRTCLACCRHSLAAAACGAYYQQLLLAARVVSFGTTTAVPGPIYRLSSSAGRLSRLTTEFHSRELPSARRVRKHYAAPNSERAAWLAPGRMGVAWLTDVHSALPLHSLPLSAAKRCHSRHLGVLPPSACRIYFTASATTPDSLSCGGTRLVCCYMPL